MFKKITTALLLIGSLVLPFSASAITPEEGNNLIKITHAVYGYGAQNCDAKSRVSAICDGRTLCGVPINDMLCEGGRDPAPGLPKWGHIYYVCGDGRGGHTSAPAGAEVVIDCRMKK